MEILIQPESRGIHYEGYESEYIQCVFEDGDPSKKQQMECDIIRPDEENNVVFDCGNGAVTKKVVSFSMQFFP
ncbi:unnamed protein product [Toxocara canis]|uniref:ZP domain-containing protein n=1 Tax=Toxocara canis TaxID=6265 RepID=A0A183U6A2_TOXCA|nr:unnamed protein product [Toxocara canis]